MNNEMPDDIYVSYDVDGEPNICRSAECCNGFRYVRADKAAPVERIEGIQDVFKILEMNPQTDAEYEDALEAEQEFTEKYGMTPYEKIEEAARAYLKLQGEKE